MLYLLSSLLAGVGAHLAYCKLLLKHTSNSLKNFASPLGIILNCLIARDTPPLPPAA